MLEKWYIQAKATSKGFFTGWNNISNYISDRMLNHIVTDTPVEYEKDKVYNDITDPKPSFTKHIANAVSYNTKEDAVSVVEMHRKEAHSRLNTYRTNARAIQEMIASGKWTSLTDDEREEFYANNTLYNQHVSYYFGKRRSHPYNIKDSDIHIVKNMELSRELIRKQLLIKREEARIEYLDKKIQVVQLDLEFKFMPKERRAIKWKIRSERQTNNEFCAGCGGAVPNIPQLVIGKKEKQRYDRDPVYLCAICVEKLAEEAKRQTGKIPQDLLEHYHQDRFLRELS